MAHIIRAVSAHAVDVIRRRGITPEQIAEVLAWPCVTEQHRGRRRLIGRNGLVLVLGDDDTLITCLVRSAEQWTDEDARKRFSA